ncbi:efflux transporter outer membrane subunit [Sphingomonas sp.]|uniref:efflux transporter outer membrane subunit n=1 Tax=Sphingomonas sp. TaxID=28214 RepID=UPI000DB35C4A|nr:efflux transporter outer membrane subunit [Sphingomonas sp.]PZU11478.1 MAG: RND transporter [Sphingomonas sp.]
MSRVRSGISAVLMLALAGCSMAPTYRPPAVAGTPAFKEAPGWQPARPADDVAKGEWWKLFADPVLDDLEARVAARNQNVASFAASYAQARAAVREARASLFPSVDLSGQSTRAGSFGDTQTTIIGSNGTTTSGGSGSRRFSVSLGGTWEPDVFGRISSGVRQQKALAQASQADLLNATLAAQGELATNYVQLRGLDQQKIVYEETIAAYERALKITTNRYDQGQVARVDVLQAQTQLANARATSADIDRQRAAFEHAIAVLVGENPSSFGLPAGRWSRAVPQVPGILPGTVIERRPDIAAAERRVAAANQGIGVERAAFFPTFTLTGDLGTQTSRLSSLFTAVSSIWSLGASTALTLLDFGGRSARVAQARASFDQAAASYRQTTLTAIQQVEDELAATRVLQTVSEQRVTAATAANRVEQLTQNQYLSGLIVYTDVITAQATALSARQQEIQAIVDRQVSAITLIQAIGGSWPASAPAQASGG